MKTISLLNMKGGVGKTTMSINLAEGMHMKGKSVLLIDLDPQANTTSMYLDEVDVTVKDIIAEGKPGENVAVEVKKGFWLIPSELSLSNAELELRMNAGVPQHNRLKKSIQAIGDALKKKIDYCFIDCPPIINLLTVNAIMASDEIIIPIKPDRFAVSGFMVTMKNIEQIRDNWDIDIDYKVLFNAVNRNNEELRITEDIRAAVAGRVVKTQIRCQPKPIAEASSQAKAVVLTEKKGIGVAEDIKRLVDELIEGVE